MHAKAADAPGTKLAVVAVARACFNCKAWTALNENVLLISKRRSQLKQARGGADARAAAPPDASCQAVTALVQECMTYLDATPDLDTKVALIKTLIAVSEGKVSLRAPVCRQASACLSPPSSFPP